MTDEPRWLDERLVRAIHEESLAMFGGATGVRDAGLLESALARPRHRLAYGGPADVFALAAAYGYGLARTPPFVDGNKRIALLAMHAFLFRNGWRFDPEQSDEVRAMLALAASDLDETDLADWLRATSAPR